MTSSQLPGGGGVRSLRAMFESSHPERSASPELRGRSPTPGSSSVRSSESNSRPTSKVRASFISVGPFDPPTSMPGENGVESPAVESPAVASSFDGDLIASPPPEASTAAHRRGSMSLDPHRDSDVLDEVRTTVSNEAEQRRASVDIQETVPEQAVLTGPTNTPFPEIKEDEAMGNFVNNEGNKLQDPELSTIPGPKEEATKENAQKAVEEAAEGLKRVELVAEEKKSEPAKESAAADDAPAPAPPAEDAKEELLIPIEEPTMGQSDKKTDVEDESAVLKPADPKEESAVSKGEALPPPVEELQPLGATAEKPATEEPAPVPEPKVEEKVEPQPEEKSNGASEPAPAPQSPEKQAEPVKIEEPKPSGTKSPVPPKTPTSPIASPKSTNSKTSSAREPAKRASRTSLKSATSTASKPRTSSRPAAERKKDITHTSPPFTKPRPKSPTRPAKLPSHLTQPTAASAAKREAEKAEEKKAAARPKTTTPRAPAVASKTTTAAASKTGADHAKKAGSRPSLPAQSTTKRPESRTARPSMGAKAPDDSFLARMMRPTAASASKTHEKKDDVKSPPRRTTSVKTKQANGDGVATKAKKKVVEGIDKAKEKVLDKDTAEKKEEDSSAPTLEPAAPIIEKPAEEEQAAEEEEGKSTPPQGAETPVQSGETMTQTPAGIEGGVIRFSTSSSMTAYSSASTSFTTSTAATSVIGTPVPSGGTSTRDSSVAADKRRSRISNLVAFFEQK
ncbi:hypothetical protein GTA08_BOTSDO04730 [Neofusicoccum parvum]|uniref:Uncharacterized protein n=1 Tax=Neofusicoccum parvum TaxID=310453 RepID=A0ACB5S1H5_9PEZI|nr:hypothetical protein GTA08_BOTSDO04730 [Neofusicoccum parvum]